MDRGSPQWCMILIRTLHGMEMGVQGHGPSCHKPATESRRVSAVCQDVRATSLEPFCLVASRTELRRDMCSSVFPILRICRNVLWEIDSIDPEEEIVSKRLNCQTLLSIRYGIPTSRNKCEPVPRRCQLAGRRISQSCLSA